MANAIFGFGKGRLGGFARVWQPDKERERQEDGRAGLPMDTMVT